MYICKECNKAIGPNVRQYKLVVKSREVSYPEQSGPKGKVFDTGGSGREIARETVVCSHCLEKLNGNHTE